MLVFYTLLVAFPRMRSPDEVRTSHVGDLKSDQKMASLPRDTEAASNNDLTSTSTDIMVRGSFPEKLMALLESEAAPDAIWWLPDTMKAKGTFAINKTKFEEDLSQKFNGNKWSSIARNLNRW